jgi:peroxidase
MSRKAILTAMVCVICIISVIKTAAQQNKTTKGRIFMNTPRPRPFPHRPGGTRPSLNHAPYRTYDGTTNNITNNQTADWGASDIPLFREIPAEYATTDRNNAMAGPNRPSPRRISNAVIDEPVTTFNSRGLSAFVYVWGQFLDHDMSLTPTGTTESVPILLPANETVFTEPIPFTRSEVRAGTGVNSVRQQTNLNTAWIDASMVYGVDSIRAKWLRTMQNGKMKTSSGNFLPYNTVTGEQTAAIDPNAPDMANDGSHTVITFVAGDVRAAEHPGIASLHTLFVREHNRICDRLRAEGLHNDEEIYQKARKEVGALIQAITYQEFLPAVGVTLSQYNGYRPGVRPDIMNTFATAGYRIGHTMVADDIMLFDNQCAEIGPGELDLITAFWNPQLLIDFNMEPFLKGFAAHTQYETDTRINSVLRNFLFGSPNDPVRFGIDLGSLNIQRGRDHGLPNYNTVRKFYTGRKATNFNQVTTNTQLADSLQNLYGSVDSMDLWIGILAEDRLPGKSVGTTMHAMLKAQFENLRDGDFYFYRNDPFLPIKKRIQILSTRFSDVLKRNTKLTNLQSNVFFTEECPANAADSVAVQLDVKTAITNSRLFPNPVTQLVQVVMDPTGQPVIIKIYTTEGVLKKTVEKAAQHKNIAIDVSDLTNGIYILNITSGNQAKSLKFIKVSD